MTIKEKLINKQSLQKILIFFIIIPLFLTLVFISPLNREFALYTAQSNIFTIYFSNYAHANYDHFKGNIVFYIIFLGLVHFANILLDIRNEKRFYCDMGLIFLTVPFIVSFFNILLYPNDNSTAFLGFSGIVSALAGYLAALVIVLIYKKANLNATNIYAFLFVVSFNLTILGLFIYSFSLDMLLLVLFIAFFSLFSVKKDATHILSILNNYKHKISNQRQFYSLLSLILVCTAYIIVILWMQLFPSTVVSEDGRVNIVGHYLGYCMGIFTPWSVYHIENLMVYLKR